MIVGKEIVCLDCGRGGRRMWWTDSLAMGVRCGLYPRCGGCIDKDEEDSKVPMPKGGQSLEEIREIIEGIEK